MIVFHCTVVTSVNGAIPLGDVFSSDCGSLVTHDEVKAVARDVGDQWMQLAVELDMDSDDLPSRQPSTVHCKKMLEEWVEKSGDNTVTGVVYGFHEDENAKYLDVRITGGTWANADIIVGDENTTTATISSITYRMQVIDLAGEFADNVTFC